MSDAAPETRAQYQVITTLGQGGMARVLLTLSRGPAGVNKLLVVKELKAELKGDLEFFTMFLDEARIAARLNHPNVVQTYEVSSDGEHPIIVMEYLEGQSLSALLSRIGRKSMPLDLHVHILSQVAVGLHYAHELKGLDGGLLNLVHRDVSPHNVFVTYDGLVKLVDFGIAKAADSAGLTQAGQFKGKLGYASPEQLGANVAPFDRRADIFALGVMLWEALAQRRLIAGEPEGVVMNRRLQGNDLKIREVAPDAPDELVRICERAMAWKPTDRFATAAELRAALEGWLDTSRRIGSEDISAVISPAFAADREKIRGLVETRVKELAAGEDRGSEVTPFSRRSMQHSVSSTSPTRNDGEGPRKSVVPGDSQRAATEPVDSTMRASSGPTPNAPPAADRRLGLTLIGVGVVVAAAVSAVQLTRGSGSTATPTVEPASTANAQAAGAQATVDVSVSAAPPEARVFLDDVALATNPFHGVLPKSPLVRRLRITAPGFSTEERLVTLDRDLALELSLKPLPAGPAASSAPGITTPTVPAHAAVPVTPATPGTAGAGSGKAAASAVPTASPGDTATNPGHTKKPRSIDTDY